MNSSIKIAHALYNKMLRIYPRSFQVQFAEEMETVFFEAAQHASCHSSFEFIRFIFRELRDWPTEVCSAYWFSLQEDRPPRIGRLNMTTINSNHHLQLNSNRQIVLAGLPLFLFGLGVTLAALIGGEPWISLPRWRFILAIVVGLIPMAGIGIGALYSLSKRTPDWSWTWIGSAYMGITLFVKTASEEQADVGKYILSEIGDILIVISVLLTGAVLITMAALKGWQRAGLFSTGAAGTLALSFCMAITVAPFHRHDLALSAAPAGLIQAYLVYLFVRGDERVKIAAILGTGVINAGIILLATSVWRQWYADLGKPSPLIALMVIINLVLVSGPVWAWFTKPLRERFGNP